MNNTLKQTFISSINQKSRFNQQTINQSKPCSEFTLNFYFYVVVFLKKKNIMSWFWEQSTQNSHGK